MLYKQNIFNVVPSHIILSTSVKFHYAEWLIVAVLSVIKLSVVMLSVAAPLKLQQTQFSFSTYSFNEEVNGSGSRTSLSRLFYFKLGRFAVEKKVVAHTPTQPSRADTSAQLSSC